MTSFWHRLYPRIERSLIPDLRHSQHVYKEELSACVGASIGLWLDLGCGRGLFPAWLEDSPSTWRDGKRIIGLDEDLDSLRDNQTITYALLGNAASTPLAGETISVVSANMVVEHLGSPAAVFAELTRILKPGGLIVFHTPNYLHYQAFLVSLLPSRLKRWLAFKLEGRRDQDVFPTFYRMNTVRQIREVARHSGLVVRRIRVVGSNPETLRLGPLVLIELLVIWACWRGPLQRFASNIIAVLEKPTATGA